MPRWVILFLFSAPLIIGAHEIFSSPDDFPAKGIIVTVNRGAFVSDIAAELANKRIIKHSGLMKIILRLSGRDVEVQAGPYLFTTPENLFAVARRLESGAHGLPPTRITFPEGETVREMAERVASAFPDISPPEFLSAAKLYEGYLFPDTYLFVPWVDAESIVKTMRENFDAKIMPLADEIKNSGRTLAETVIMASLVEKEARSSEVRRTVAGILFNRLARGMPLQVDAIFGYIFGRDTYSPSFEDLKVDSPYNTYIHTGFPPGPINNPGLDAIEAVLNPTKTDYLYYLTDIDGRMHYARTYSEHQSNQRKYLKTI